MSRSSITVEKNFNLGKIRFDFTKQLNESGQIIKTDHYQRLEGGQGVDGSQMKALSPVTVALKGNSKILVKSGKMRNLIVEEASKTNQQVEIHPGRKQTYKGTKPPVTMADVGGFHQKGGRNLPKREWFGISKNAEKQCINLMEERMAEEIRRA